MPVTLIYNQCFVQSSRGAYNVSVVLGSGPDWPGSGTERFSGESGPVRIAMDTAVAEVINFTINCYV